MVTYHRKDFVEKVIDYIRDRTTPGSYRLIVVDNGSNDDLIDMLRKKLIRDELLINLGSNLGLEMAKNHGLREVRSARYVDLDSDCLAPKLEPDWLTQMHDLMDRHPDFGAIALRCQLHVGVGALFKDAPEVKENNVAGGSFRMMDTDLVRKVGGWRNEANQNRSEEHYISGRIREEGKKVGYATNIFTYHMFGEDHAWGYGTEDHKHGDRKCPYVDSMFNDCDPLTNEPKVHKNE
jgi:GT2 family glycosyltransferase